MSQKQIVYVITTHTECPELIAVCGDEQAVRNSLRDYQLEQRFDRTTDYDSMMDYLDKQGPLCGDLYFSFIDDSETPDYQRKAVKVTPMLVR